MDINARKHGHAVVMVVENESLRSSLCKLCGYIFIASFQVKHTRIGTRFTYKTTCTYTDYTDAEISKFLGVVGGGKGVTNLWDMLR